MAGNLIPNNTAHGSARMLLRRNGGVEAEAKRGARSK